MSVLQSFHLHSASTKILLQKDVVVSEGINSTVPSALSNHQRSGVDLKDDHIPLGYTTSMVTYPLLYGAV